MTVLTAPQTLLRLRRVEVGRLLVTAFASVLFAVGWFGAKAVGVAWLLLTWSAAAVRVGWQDGRGAAPNHRRT